MKLKKNKIKIIKNDNMTGADSRKKVMEDGK